MDALSVVAEAVDDVLFKVQYLKAWQSIKRVDRVHHVVAHI